jgi:acyl-CoA synthetase (AMP-forming)/AMP-acid ligase II
LCRHAIWAIFVRICTKNARRRGTLSDWPDFATIADVVRVWGRLRPQHIAIRRGAKTFTYAELDRRSDHLAMRMRFLGREKSEPVAYLGGNSPFVFEAWFAAAKAGHVFAPLNWRSPPAELATVLADAAPFVIFVDQKHLANVRAALSERPASIEIVPFEPDDHTHAIDLWTGAKCGQDPGGPDSPGDDCLLGYTSGTTGRPKGVAMSHAAFVGGFNSGRFEPAMAWSRDDVVAMAMPNFHLGGSFLSMQALMTGATLTVLPTFEIGELLATVAEHRVTVLPLVPTAIQMLLDDPRLAYNDVSTVRSVVYFGAPISVEVLRRAMRAFSAEMLQYYGTTESWTLTFLDAAGHDPTNSQRLSSCGKPVPGVELRLADENGRDVEAGEIGEIIARSPSMFSGYWRNPQATAAAFRDGWYRTGDLARRDAEGFYYIVDRAKDMIVSGGENVYSAEVEYALSRYPGVAAVAVIGLPDARWGERVVAVVVPSPGADVSADTLKAHCRTLLAGYKVPKQVEFASSLPLTANGKIHKPTLRAAISNTHPAVRR